MKRIIAMSLYGDLPLYTFGARENINLLEKVYPGWTLRIYTDNDLFDSARNNVEIVRMKKSVGSSGMFWRFLAADDPEAEYVIFRDADSRLNVREKAAVDEWIASGKTLHVLRDHPDHAYWELLGGAFGLKGGQHHGMWKLVADWPHHTTKLDDMKFLREIIWPRYKHDMLHHSSVPTPHPHAHPFPPHPEYKGFVGEIVQPKC